MYKVDIDNKTLKRMTKTTFCNKKLKERYDIQEWVEKNPEIIDEDLLIIGKEVPLPSDIRIDLLAIDKKSNLVIIELKRDDSGRNVDWQAIKYASYCSNFTNTEIFRLYAEYLGTTEDEAETEIEKFIEAENFEELNNKQRIILVSKEFHSDVISAVLWLRDYGIELSCVRFTPYIDDIGDLFIAPTKIIPLPEAEDYLIKKEKKHGNFNFDRRLSDRPHRPVRRGPDMAGLVQRPAQYNHRYRSGYGDRNYRRIVALGQPPCR